jgi:hypothetical protein
MNDYYSNDPRSFSSELIALLLSTTDDSFAMNCEAMRKYQLAIAFDCRYLQ